MSADLVQRILIVLIRLIALHLAVVVMSSAILLGVHGLAQLIPAAALFFLARPIVNWVTAQYREPLHARPQPDMAAWFQFVVIAAGVFVGIQALARVPLDFAALYEARQALLEARRSSSLGASQQMSILVFQSLPYLLEAAVLIFGAGRIVRLIDPFPAQPVSS